MSKVKVTKAVHNLGENTHAFKTNDVNEVYFTVSENNWSDRARGTFMVFTGAYEHSNMLKDHIEKLTDSGFDVITVDMPGTGQSFRHSEIGTQNLNHMDSYDERVTAAQTAIQYYQDNFANGQEVQIHALTSGNGNVDFLKTAIKLEAGSLQSATMINPHFDVDFNHFGLDTRPFADYDTDIDLALNTDREIQNFVGGDVTKQFLEASVDKVLPKSTEQYVNTYADGVSDLQDSSRPYVDVLKNNGVGITVLHDADDGSDNYHTLVRSDDGELNDQTYTKEWFKGNGLRADIKSFEGAEDGIMYDFKQLDNIIQEAVTTAEMSAPRARVIGLLKQIDENEWETSLSRNELKDLQKVLEDKGFSVGPTGIDGEVRYGSVSFTEHALADFIMEAEKQGKVDLSDIKNADIAPKNLLDFVKNTELEAPRVQAVPNAPSLSAF